MVSYKVFPRDPLRIFAPDSLLLLSHRQDRQMCVKALQYFCVPSYIGNYLLHGL